MRAFEDVYHGTNPFEVDTDGDGLTDYEEIKVYDTDPKDNDTDDDRLNDYVEVKIHNTNPNKKDTNSDGLIDYVEVNVYNTDPTKNDTDGDGLDDYAEIKVHDTDPTKNDTDSDGLTDYEEVEKYNTNPRTRDTNRDGLTDYEEVKIYDTDPTKNDTNGDGLTDAEEVKIYDTNPLKNDTDNDNLSDFDEVNIYDSDPTKKDSDSDGLTDYEEVKIYDTEVNDPDTSDNGLNDSTEIELGTDPNVWDSSGDGLPDGYTYHNQNLDVKRLNVVVEVDKTQYSDNISELDEVSKKFENAPVESDLGKDGINLFLKKNNRTLSDKKVVDLRYYTSELYNERKMKRSGSYHVLFSKNVKYNETKENINGVTRKNINGMLVQTNNMSEKDVSSTFMHELGHQLGLWPSVFDGIDSSKYNRTEYPSVMNYNKPSCSYKEIQNDICQSKTELEYTESEWEYIADNLDKVATRYSK